MTAIQAKEMMVTANEQTIENLYQQVESRARDGYNSTFTKSKLTDAQVGELVEQGFVVEYSLPNNCHLVSWA